MFSDHITPKILTIIAVPFDFIRLVLILINLKCKLD